MAYYSSDAEISALIKQKGRKYKNKLQQLLEAKYKTEASRAESVRGLDITEQHYKDLIAESRASRAASTALQEKQLGITASQAATAERTAQANIDATNKRLELEAQNLELSKDALNKQYKGTSSSNYITGGVGGLMLLKETGVLGGKGLGGLLGIGEKGTTTTATGAQNLPSGKPISLAPESYELGGQGIENAIWGTPEGIAPLSATTTPTLEGITPLTYNAEFMGTEVAPAGLSSASFMSYLQPAGLGLAAGALGGKLGEEDWFQSITPWGGGSTEKKMAGTLAGFGVGALMGGESLSMLGLPGWAVGGILGGIGGFLGASSVICTELNRQGYISDELIELEKKYRDIDLETYLGYRILANPVVKWMQKSKLVTQIVRPFATAYIKEVTSRVSDSKGSLLGKMILKIGVPICKYIYNRKMEVQYA